MESRILGVSGLCFVGAEAGQVWQGGGRKGLLALASEVTGDVFSRLQVGDLIVGKGI